jgi:hypothetical protein
VRPEWNTELSKGDLDQVDELLAIIAAHKEIGVTGVSVMFSFFKRWIQPIQQCHTLGFEYIGAEDPSRMCAEELTDDATLIRVKRVILCEKSSKTGKYSTTFLEKVLLFCHCQLKIFYRDTQSCTGAIHHNPTSPDRTTFSPATQPKQKGLKQPRLCPTVRQLKVGAPWRKGKPKGRR